MQAALKPPMGSSDSTEKRFPPVQRKGRSTQVPLLQASTKSKRVTFEAFERAPRGSRRILASSSSSKSPALRKSLGTRASSTPSFSSPLVSETLVPCPLYWKNSSTLASPGAFFANSTKSAMDRRMLAKVGRTSELLGSSVRDTRSLEA
jgi:hypothetical protein